MKNTILTTLKTTNRIFITNKQYIMDYHLLIRPLVSSILFSSIGILLLLIAYFFIEKLTPEKSWKEIVENKNIALAIIFGSFILGISLIIASAIHGG